MIKQHGGIFGRNPVFDSVTSTSLDVQSSGDTTLQVKSTGTGDADAFVYLDGSDTGESSLSFRTDGVENAYISLTGGTGGDINIGTQADNRNIDFQPNDVVSVRFVPYDAATGTIIDIFANGSHSGSIGAQDGDLWIGEDGVGLQFQNTGTDRIDPFDPNNNTTRDDEINLGSTSNRFKDLYLSGGVRLGGTDAANSLSDYEEGSWTVTVATGSVTGATTAKYIKCGTSVTVWVEGVSFSDTTSAADITIGGLPFTAAQSGQGSIICSYVGASSPNTVNVGGTTVKLYSSFVSGAFSAVQHSAFNSTANQLYFTVTYQST